MTGVTILEASHCHRRGDKLGSMKGKYPNGLQDAMKAAEIGPTELAKLAETSKQNVDRLASGARELTGIWAQMLAPHVRVPPEALVFPGWRPTATKVPLLSWVAAGRLTTQEGVTNVDAKKHVSVADLPVGGTWIALTVEGDSMNLIAPPGSIIIVNRGDIVLKDERFYVIATGEGASTFKRYRDRGGTARFQPFSTNPDHETYYPDEPLHVVGRVRRVITELK